MYKIVRKEVLNPSVSLIEVEAPYIARKAEPGQFIILRVSAEGERICRAVLRPLRRVRPRHAASGQVRRGAGGSLFYNITYFI